MTMSLRISLAVAAAGLAFAAASATAAPTALTNCGSVRAGHTTWQVSAVGIACVSARSLVKKLGAMPTPPRTLPYYPGTFLGMRCLGGKANGKKAIDCGGTGGKALAAIAS
jgi:hypothetical protein